MPVERCHIEALCVGFSGLLYLLLASALYVRVVERSIVTVSVYVL